MISIIVPIYKVQKYLTRCVDSLINQNYRDLEIILVDDGSPDRCGAICDEYATRDSRIHVIHQANGGISLARNVGLAVSSGDYIGFVDPDDWIQPDMYQQMLDVITTRQADLVICGYQYHHENGSMDETRPYLERETELINQEELLRRFGDMPPTVRHVVWNKLFRRLLLQDLRYDEQLHISQDVPFIMECAMRCRDIVVIHRPLYHNLVRDGSATHGGVSVPVLVASFSAADMMYRETVRRYPALQPHAIAFLLDVCTLRYREALRKDAQSTREDHRANAQMLRQMRGYIRRMAWKALLDRQIYWKTRIMYLFIK